MIFHWYLLGLFSFLSLDPPHRFEIRGFAQGTTYQIIYYADSNRISKNEIDGIFVTLDSSLSVYKPYSQINQFNQDTTGLKLDSHLKKVVENALKISKDTDGVFDITVFPLVDAWGFGVRHAATIPDSSTIASLLMCTGSYKLVLHQDSLVKSLPCVQIDVNGIAQGYSVDFIAEILDRKGISDYLVEIGGEIKAKGQKQPSKQSFVIGLEGPSENDDETYVITKKVKIENGALTTSGNYRKFHLEGNKKRSHLIDAKTGFPIDNEMISVTVLAKDAMTADGYDNAFMGMGMEQSMRFLSQQDSLEAYMIYYNAEGVVADTATAGFYKLMGDRD